MFYFIVAGLKDVVRGRASGFAEMRFCPRCGTSRRFVDATSRRFLTLFFFPVVPVSGRRAVRVCEACGTVIASPEQAASADR